MRLLPVIDLKDGLVVRGIAGRRDQYRPIKSLLVADPRPETVARTFFALGFRDVYVADLDAIGGLPPALECYQQIAATGLSLIVDAGIRTAADVEVIRRCAESGVSVAGVVFASETVEDHATLRAAMELAGAERSIFSLDLKNGSPVVTNAAWGNAEVEEILSDVIGLGLQRVILLDVAAVGVGSGPVTLDLCRKLFTRWPDIEIISGGGIRNEADARALMEVGCRRVLIASALHDGRVTPF